MGRTVRNGAGAPRALATLGLALALLVVWAAAAHAARLSGTIASQTGGDPLQPLQGATVAVTAGGAPVASATTDAAGAYDVTLPSGTYDVVVTATGWEPARRDGVAVAGADALDATLVPTGHGRVHGIVRDADGRPVPGVVARLGWHGEAGATVGAADGTFSLAAPLGTTRLRIAGGPAGASWTFDDEDFSLPADQAVAVDVPATTDLTVRVLGLRDAPIANAAVRVPEFWLPLSAGDGVDGAIGSPGGRGVTDSAGELVASVMDGGRAGGFEPYVRVDPPAGSFYEITLAHGIAMSGPTTVTVRPARYARLMLTVLDPLGAFAGGWASINGGREFGDDIWTRERVIPITAAEGTSVLRVRLAELRFTSDPFELTGEMRETLQLPAWEFTDITVLDEDGDPVEGAVVSWPETSVRIESGWIDGTLAAEGDSRTTYPDGRVRMWRLAGAVGAPGAVGSVVPPSGSGLEPGTFPLSGLGARATVVLAATPPTP